MNDHEKLGKYRISAVIGEGGMGRVYEATDPVIGRRVAIKVISLEVDTPDARARFFREAQAAGRLSHPNIITIHDIGVEPDQPPYIVMEFLEGTDLSRQLADGHLSIEKKIEIAVDICDGLSHAHERGIVHRDIKPANVFVTAQGHAKIVDFGLARGDTSDITHTGTILGTPNYMAPEQIRGEPIDYRADIFSVGVVLYELFSGRKPFAGDSVAATIYKVLQTEPPLIHTVDTGLPPALSNVIRRAIAKDKAERYQSVRELRDALVALWMGRRSEPSDVSAFTIAVHRADQITTPGPTLATPGVAAPAERSASRTAWLVAAGVGAIAIAVVAFVVGGNSRTPLPSAGASVPVAPPAASANSATPPSDPSSTAAAPMPTVSASASQPAGAPAARSTLPARGDAPPRETRRAEAARGDTSRGDAARSATGAASTQPRPNPAVGERTAAAPTSTVPRDQPPQAPLTALGVAVVAPPPPPEPRSDARRQSAEPPAVPPAAAATPAAPKRAESDAPAAREANALAAIQKVVGDYRDALEARDLGALKRIWPSLSGRQEDAIRSEFDRSRAIRVGLSAVQTDVSGSTATVSCTRRYAVTTVDGQRLDTSSRTTMTLAAHEGTWVIETIRFEANR